VTLVPEERDAMDLARRLAEQELTHRADAGR
jgi:hypothetical protein